MGNRQNQDDQPVRSSMSYRDRLLLQTLRRKQADASQPPAPPTELPADPDDEVEHDERE